MFVLYAVTPRKSESNHTFYDTTFHLEKHQDELGALEKGMERVFTPALHSYKTRKFVLTIQLFAFNKERDKEVESTVTGKGKNSTVRMRKRKKKWERTVKISGNHKDDKLDICKLEWSS